MLILPVTIVETILWLLFVRKKNWIIYNEVIKKLKLATRHHFCARLFIASIAADWLLQKYAVSVKNFLCL
jgi:hypothetical protein